MDKSYNKTLYACFIGYIVQAIVNNFVPLLFLAFHNSYGIPMTQITLLITFNFGLQLLVDILSVTFIDRIGYRASMVIAHICAVMGFVFLTILPDRFKNAFTGLMIAVAVYAVGGGLLEVLVSPVVEACPTKNKEKAMSLLHSFYCWGHMAVVVVSTAFFYLFGIENWKILTLIWTVIMLYNAFNFMTCPIERLVEDGEGMRPGQLLRLPLFWLLILLMVCSGASEASMAQWASAFTESAMGVSKTVGDLAGPCLFAMFMGISRVLYGKKSEKLDLIKTMLMCGVLSVICYLTASLSSLPIIGLAGCAFCGISVGIMWPGSISISSQKCPRGGTVMFAFLALAGDLGATISPTIVGCVSNIAGGNLKLGLLVATVFPLILIFVLLVLNRKSYL